MISAWVYIGLALLIVFSLGVFVGALVGSPGSRGHGGTVDLSRGAARGELDLNWNDPRPDPRAAAQFRAQADTYADAMTATAPRLIRVSDDAVKSLVYVDAEPDRRPSFGV